jgi:hypothetical protein
VGTLVQYVVTPVLENGTPQELVLAAAAHPDRMQAAVWLDLPLLLLVPALLFVGGLAGAATSRLAAVATALTFVTSLAAFAYLLALDPLLVAAAGRPDRAAATAVVDSYQSSGIVLAVVLPYLVGQVVGFLLLGLALRRAGTVPLWVAVATGVWPVVHILGALAGVKPLAALGYVVFAAGFGGCAAALLRGRTAEAPAGAAARYAVTGV